MTKVTLTQGQADAADAFFDFLMTPDRTFGISGSAGVGKTFLMSHIANHVMKLYEQSCAMIDVRPEFDEVMFTATTNKAAEVLETSLGAPVRTIHSVLGLKVKENYRTGKTTLERTANYKIRKNKILFIDECSMVDKALYNEIMEAFPDCKVVFVGDHAQMAPVNESLSKVYLELDPTNLVTLTEPVRNSGQPALVDLCAQLRDTVETGIFRPIQEVPGVIDYLDDTSMPANLMTHFKELNPSCRVLCYTNTRVQAYNEFIREDVRGLPLEPQPGDILVVASAFAMGKTTLSVERELEVFSVGPIEENTSFENIVGEVIPYRTISLGMVGGSASMEIPVAVDGDRVTTLIKRLARERNWGDYFDLKAAFADLRDKASCTVYKSQGSTYDSVFVDLGNIGTAFSPEQVARMLFVAISRARSRVYLYGDLPSQYVNSRGKPLWKVQDTSSPSSQSSSSETTNTSLVDSVT